LTATHLPASAGSVGYCVCKPYDDHQKIVEYSMKKYVVHLLAA